MDKLYKFHWDCGRQGDVEGVFIADEQEVKDIIGETISFGEILGKHSDIVGIMEQGDITELDVSENTIKELRKVIGMTISGYNPLYYISYKCSDCEALYGAYEVDWYVNDNGDKYCEYCCSDEEIRVFKKL